MAQNNPYYKYNYTHFIVRRAAELLINPNSSGNGDFGNRFLAQASIVPPMAAAILRRTLISFYSGNNSSLLLKSHFSASPYFSTTATNPPLDHHTVTKFLIDDHRLSPEAAAQIASRSRIRNQQSADSIIQFLKNTGFSDAQLEKVLKSSPQLLSSHLDATIKPKFEILHGLGFAPADILDIVATQSRLLNYSAPRISSSIVTLKSVLGSAASAARFLKTTGLFLRDMESTLLPNVESLKSCGVSTDQITTLMCQNPRFFLHKPENMRRFIEKADQLGSDRKSGRFIHAVRIISSMASETWRLKLEAFRELGFSDEDIARAFRNSPKVFSTSAEKMRRVAAAVEGSGGYDRRSIVETPSVFLYSLEKRIWPRLKVLRVLEEEKKMRRENWPSLATIVVMKDAKFSQKFVSPNFDLVGGFFAEI
ncbi:uncharacterized protein LOC121765949 [Salvia splendens]|uniref:uncharacterized protein LOC121765949 n=1 Tax=Salvia splendens TaxID=180675 RepID=UPI001C27E8BB|nr:uncharacterized protein LOC121765949 [Salvia splendens]